MSYLYLYLDSHPELSSSQLTKTLPTDLKGSKLKNISENMFSQLATYSEWQGPT